MQSDAMKLLASTGLFDLLDETALNSVESALETVRVPSGEILFREGDPGDCLYVLIYGRLMVTSKGESGREDVIGEIGRGEVVGEMAILSGEPRFGTALAIRDSELVKFSKDAFEQVLKASPHAMMLIAKRLITRLRSMRHPYAQTKLSTIALINLDSGAPFADFSQGLSSAFKRAGTTVHLNRQAVEKEFGTAAFESDSAIGLDVRVWLDKLEVNQKFVVYEADPQLTPWTKLCIRQADRILLVARAESSPDPGKIEELERIVDGKTMCRMEWVLLHAEGALRPRGTRKWLELLRAARTHHHFRLGPAGDYDRLVRLLTGSSVGVVLGGGGARGLAHIGVLRALEDSGIPIDVIAGTSMGSVIAAQHALGLDHKSKMEINKKGWVDLDPFRDKTLPLMAMLSCRKLDRMLAFMFGDAAIEDLWIKFFCISANITQAEMVVHSDGLLARAVRSSLAIPGVAVPIFDKGDLIVDGGVLNNLPGDVMRRLYGGKVIVVDVSAQKDLSIDTRLTKAPSPWRILWSRINPFASRIDVPNILAIMMRTMLIGSLHNTKMVARDADLYVRPPIEKYGMFEWGALDKIVDAGYQFGMEKIREWQEAQRTAGTAE